MIEEIIGNFPKQTTQVICGDWNTRVGELSPTIDDIQLQRRSEDRITNTRAPWLLETCE